VRRSLRPLACLILAALSVLLPSCANKEEDPDRVSTIPWNRPEKWEGQGPLGGMGMGSR
jgi:hypothetical protein